MEKIVTAKNSKEAWLNDIMARYDQAVKERSVDMAKTMRMQLFMWVSLMSLALSIIIAFMVW